MKRLLLLSITLFLLLPLAGATFTVGIGEPVSVSLKGTIKAQELTISVRGEGRDDDLIGEDDILTFDFPITAHDKRSWVQEVPLHFAYSSNQNLRSGAYLTFSVGEFRGDNGGILKPELRTDNLSSNTFVIDPDPNRIQVKTTFEAGRQDDTPIGTVIVVFKKTEEELFPVGNYTGEFFINFRREN
ncbi:MAG: hypothetical protein GX911_05560 [Spirochaetales bacterium]|nr:hypothetical protein [Spirochaetales bacterium]